MAHYKNISIDEIRDLLRPEKGWKETDKNQITNTEIVKEKVFQYNLKKYPFILVRVYSGIVNGESRKVGRDAIRVCAINLKTDKGWIKSKRVHRVEGWRDNLKSRIVQVIKDSNQRFAEYEVKYGCWRSRD